MSDRDSDEDGRFEMCDFSVDVDISEQSNGSFEVEEDGHKCVNEAVAKVTLQTHSGSELDFWVCDEHLESERDAGNVVEVVERINDNLRPDGGRPNDGKEISQGDISKGRTSTGSNFDGIGVDSEKQRTPVGATPIVLNPKVSENPLGLCCPDCREEVECWSAPNKPIFEYRCGCDDLRQFEIRGVDDE